MDHTTLKPADVISILRAHPIQHAAYQPQGHQSRSQSDTDDPFHNKCNDPQRSKACFKSASHESS